MKEEQKFDAGESVFTIDGYEVEYVAKSLDGGHVVRYIVLDEDGCPHTTRIGEVDKVFKVAPTDLKDKKIAELDTAIDQRRAALNEVNAQIRQAEATRRRFEKDAGLKNLGLLIDRKITHVVRRYRYWENKIEVVSLKDLSGYRDHLLSVAINKDGTTLTTVYDREGDSHGCVFLAESEETATEFAKELVANLIQNPPANLAYLIESAEAFGISVPPEMYAIRTEVKMKELRGRETRAASELNGIRAQITALEPTV